MRHCLAVLLIVLLTLTSLLFAQSAKPLTNTDIVEMVKANLAEAVILKVIETSEAAFDTSTQGLIALQNAKVSEKIVGAMISARKSAVSDAMYAGAPQGLPTDPGVYYRSPAGLWTKLDKPEADPKASKMRKSRGASLIGIGSIQYIEAFQGEKAQVQIPDTQPVFHVRLLNQPAVAGLNPPEVGIFRLEIKKGGRQFQFGSYSQGAIGLDVRGPKEKDSFEVETKQVENNLYTLRPKKILSPGEYLLKFSDNRGYDFGISK